MDYNIIVSYISLIIASISIGMSVLTIIQNRRDRKISEAKNSWNVPRDKDGKR